VSVPTGAPVEVGAPLVRIPTDVEYEERVWGPLTLRQAAALAATGGVLYAGWWGTRGWLPTLAFLPVAAAVAALVLVLVTTRRDGQSLDRWMIAALTHRATTRTVEHPITDQAPAWLAAHAAPLDPRPGPGAHAGIGEPVREPRRTPRLPSRAVYPANAVNTIGGAGVVDLGPDGYAALAVADPVDLGLRTPAEQAALIAGFAGLLHALTAGIQILIRAVPLDVAEEADQLLAAAEHLPHPALAAAARDHAGFLYELAAGHDLLRRQVIVILREPRPLPTTPTPAAGGGRARWRRRRAEPSAAVSGSMSVMAVQAAYARLARRLGELVDLAAPAGITLHPLRPEQAAAVLAAACHPARGVLSAHLAPPEHVITGPPSTTTTGTSERRRSR
jgi:PrgI family protein